MSILREYTSVTQFLEYLREQVPSFVEAIINELQTSKFGVDVANLQADHVCYRTETIAQYTSLVKALQSADSIGLVTLLVESMIGGRPIATFKLSKPIDIGSENNRHSIDVIEIPSPKEGSPYTAGLEHIEFVVGDGSHKSPLNDEVHARVLDEWMKMHQNISWNTKARNKECNPDVSLKIELCDYGKVSVKFHLMPLEEVIKIENEFHSK